MVMDIEEIIAKVAIGVIGGAAAWVMGSIASLRRESTARKKDLNAAFVKIRQLEECNAKRTD